MSDNSSLQHYRLSVLGHDLAETLDELIKNDMFDEKYRELVMEKYEIAMKDTIGKQAKSKTAIKGKLSHYRNHDDIWTFFLKSMEMKQDGLYVSTNEKTQIICVPKKNRT